MIISLLWLIIGLVLIMVGANALTDGAASVARRFGMSDMIVGLTVIAFGTSAPELTISVIASLGDESQLAVGNVVGSNIINILLIVGATALIRPIKVERSVMTAELPMLITSALLLLLFGNSSKLNGYSENMIMRTDGILLLLLFVLFIRYTISAARRQAPIEADNDAKEKEMPLVKAIVFIVVGLLALVWGGDKFVDGASDIAIRLGMSKATVGLTIVAAGTSLPELATSITAAIKGHPGMVVGNVIGSNIFNTLLVLGASATVAPLSFNGITNIDLSVLVISSILFWLFAKVWGTRTINHSEGALLLIGYIAYTIYLLQ
jgi:cation:H+ antiporter